MGVLDGRSLRAAAGARDLDARSLLAARAGGGAAEQGVWRLYGNTRSELASGQNSPMRLDGPARRGYALRPPQPVPGVICGLDR